MLDTILFVLYVGVPAGLLVFITGLAIDGNRLCKVIIWPLLMISFPFAAMTVVFIIYHGISTLIEDTLDTPNLLVLSIGGTAYTAFYCWQLYLQRGKQE